MRYLLLEILSLILTANQAYGAELGISLSQVGDNPTTLSIGQKQQMMATCSFVPYETATGVVIEIVTSASQPPVFAFGEVTDVTIGGGINITKSTFADDIVLQKAFDTGPEDGIAYTTVALFDLGDVANTGGGVDDAFNQISITYEIVCVSGGVGNASTGVALAADGQTPIGAAKMFYNITESAPSVDASTFSIAKLTSLSLGPPVAVNLTMVIYQPKANVTVSVMSSNAAVFVQAMRVVETGKAYAYSLVLDKLHKNQYSTCPQGTSLDWNIGTLVNKESQGAASNATFSTIVIEITLQVMDLSTVGNTAWLAALVDMDGTSAWTGDFNYIIYGYSQTPTFTQDDYLLAIQSGSSNITASYVAIATVTMTIPSYSFLDYNIKIATVPDNITTGAALGIVSVTQTSTDEHLPCEIDAENLTTLVESEEKNGVYDSATLAFNITNNGYPAPSSASLVLEIKVLMMPTAAIGDTHHLTVDINNLGVQQVAFTMGVATEYSHNANYTYDYRTICESNQYEVGSRVNVWFMVGTERGVVAGPMYIEAPLPVDAGQTSSHFTFEEAVVLKKGQNVYCAAENDIPYEWRSWPNDSSGELDVGFATIPAICNMALLNDSIQDELTFRVTARIKELPELYGTEQSFKLAIQIGSTEPWQTTITFNVTAPIDLGSAKAVIGLRMSGRAIPKKWPSVDNTLMWSTDNTVFNETGFEWDTDKNILSHDYGEFTLLRPVVARYFKLTSACRANYTVIVGDLETEMRFFGDSAKTGVLLDSMHLALDTNMSTSVPLPTRLSTTTPQYFWVSIDLSYFGRPSQNSSYTVVVVGHGLSCGSKAGQVTKVTHPDSEQSTHFTGKRRLCLLQHEEDTDVKTCKYLCDCRDIVTCKDFNLLIYYIGQTIPSPYDLVELKVE